jgi:hypothetical protein
MVMLDWIMGCGQGRLVLSARHSDVHDTLARPCHGAGHQVVGQRAVAQRGITVAGDAFEHRGQGQERCEQESQAGDRQPRIVAEVSQAEPECLPPGAP